MRIKDHLDKISWSFGNRMIFLFWGLMNLVIIAFSDPQNYGLYFTFTQMITYLTSASDSFALQGIIQFGNEKHNRPKVNLIALSLQSVFLFVIPVFILIFRHPLAEMLGDPQFVTTAYYFPMISVFIIPRLFAYKIFMRDLDYKLNFSTDLVNFGTMTLVIFYFIYEAGFLSINELIISYFIGSAISGIYTFILLSKRVSILSIGDMTYKRYLNFTLPWTVHVVFYSLIKYLDVVIISIAITGKEALVLIGLYGSAKTLFKVFEQLSDGAVALIYPSTVKNIEHKDKVRKIMTKGTSFLFVTNLIVVFLLEIGGADLIVENFLPERFADTLVHFKILLIGALFLPFAALNIILTALNRIKEVVLISIFAAVVGVLTIFILAYFGLNELVSLGLVVNYFVIGAISFYLVKRELGFPIKESLRAFTDTKNFIKELRNK